MTVFDEHPGEDALVAHALGEDGVGEGEPVVQHLARCAACRAVVDETRDAVAAAGDVAVPAPDAGFEDRIWQRVVPTLPAPRRRWSPVPLVGFAALAATLAAVSVSGYWWIHRAGVMPAATPTAAATGSEDTRHRVLFTALDGHLSQTEMLLVELLNAPDEGSFGYERAVADDLLQSARLYRATAEELGQGPIGSVLDEVQPVLIEVARAPEAIDAADLASIRKRIDAGDLLFKVRVAAQDVRDRQHEPGSSEGAS